MPYPLITDRQIASKEQQPVDLVYASPGYFGAMGIGLIGRLKM